METRKHIAAEKKGCGSHNYAKMSSKIMIEAIIKME